jgi:predicted amidohydrolase
MVREHDLASFHVNIGRRRFAQGLAASLLLGGYSFAAAATGREQAGGFLPRRLKVAAIQMAPKLGDVEANLAQAEQLIGEAISRGAEWVLLPEMFTSAAACHPDMARAIRPLDGAPAQLLRNMAHKGNAVVGGSFLAQDGDQVYNAFLLAYPDGTTYRHDKDLATYWETCYYRGGSDDGVLRTPAGAIGVALCWEMVRSGTARRLLGHIQLLIAGSTWWTLPEAAGADHPLRAVNLKMLQDAPPRLARMLGVPVVHASHAGAFEGFDSPELPDVPYRSVYLGETRITDAAGHTLARMSLDEGAGVIRADVALPAEPFPLEPIPERFWLPEEMPQEWKDAWERWFPRGEDYYKTVTLPYLATGELEDYVPPYLR